MNSYTDYAGNLKFPAVQGHFKWFSAGTLVGRGALKNEYKK